MASGILPPDPLFCFRENMGPVHALCFPQRNPDYSDILLAGTEKGDVYFWDLEASIQPPNLVFFTITTTTAFCFFYQLTLLKFFVVQQITTQAKHG